MSGRSALFAIALAIVPSTAIAQAPQSLEPLFRMIVLLQAGDADHARALVASHPAPRPVLVRSADGRLGQMLGGATTTFESFSHFPAGVCRIVRITPQADKPTDINAYDVFFDCQGEGRAMQVTLANNSIVVTDFANIVLPPQPIAPTGN